MRSRWSGTTIVLSLALAGCTEDDPCAYAVCDISDPACIDAVAVAVSCRRGGDVLEPDVRFATLDEVAQEIEPPTPEQLELDRQYWAGEALVGLMPKGYDPAQTFSDSFEGVLAYYSSSDDAITVILDDDANPRLRYEVMVHEMQHAYQDAEHDLQALREQHGSTFDRFMGLRAATEGEADLYTLFASLELDNVSKRQVDWSATFAQYTGRSLELAQQSETPSLDALRLFPYSFGSRMAWNAWEDGGPAAVSDLLTTPPDSAREVMGPYKGGRYGTENRDAELLPRAVPILPGHTYLGGSAQGAWLYNAMLQRVGGSPQEWDRSSEELAADYLSIFRNDTTGEPVAVWRLLFEPSVTPTFAGRWRWPQNATTHLSDELDDTWLLVATEASDVVAVQEAIAGWESPEEAYARAGMDEDGPARRRSAMERRGRRLQHR